MSIASSSHWEAIASRLEAIATRVEAIASRVEAIARSHWEAIARVVGWGPLAEGWRPLQEGWRPLLVAIGRPLLVLRFKSHGFFDAIHGGYSTV